MIGVRFLFLINCVVYYLATSDIVFFFGLHFPYSNTFHLHQIFTYMFLHGNMIHIVFNMFALYVFGTALEKQWGTKRFLFYYLTCGVGAACIYLLTTMHKTQEANMMIGASGAVFGLLLAFGMTFPNKILHVYFIQPVKAKWFVVLYALIEIIMGVINYKGDISAHYTHIGGMLTGFIFLRLSYHLRG